MVKSKLIKCNGDKTHVAVPCLIKYLISHVSSLTFLRITLDTPQFGDEDLKKVL